MEKKVVMISPFENNMTKRGDRFPMLARMLLKNKFEVTYITTDFYHAEKRHFSRRYIESVLKETPYKQIVLRNIGYKNDLSLQRVMSHISFSVKVLLLLLKEDYDVIILPSRPSELIFVVSIIKKLKGNNVILDVSDIWPDDFPVNDFRKLLFKVYCNIFLYPSLKCIVNYAYTAPNYLRWIKRYNKEFNAIFIPLGFNKDRWDECKPIEEVTTPISLVYVGNINEKINLYPILKVLKSTNKYTLTIIGVGDRLADVKRFVNENKINNVFFTGYLSKQDVVKVFNKSHISLIPLVGEGIPNKLFDSLGAYRPILAFGENDTSKFILKHDIGWKVPYDERELIKFLDNLKVEDIIEKSKNISKIRNKYIKEELCLKFVNLLRN